MSKVIHMRLRDESLLGCIDLLTNAGLNTQGMSKAMIVSRAVDGMIGIMRKNRLIPGYEDAEAVVKELSRVMSVEYLPGKGIVTDMADALDIVRETTPDETAETDSGLRDLIKQRVEELTTPDAEVEGELFDKTYNEADAKAVLIQPINLAKTDRLAFTAIKAIAPKDKLVEQAENNAELTLALEIVYASMPASDWGGETAERLVSQVYNNFLKFGIPEEGE